MTEVELNPEIEEFIQTQEVAWRKHMLLQIENFVDAVLGSDMKAFTTSRFGMLVRKSILADFFYSFFNSLDIFNELGCCSPRVRLYFDSVRKVWNFYPCRWEVNDEVPGTGMLAGEIFNRTIEAIREMSAKTLCKAARRREREYFSYTDDLFQIYSRLMVVRIDLRYAKINAGTPDVGSEDLSEVDKLNGDLQHLLNNVRHKPSLFEYLVGYIVKLETGHEGGVHAHCILFFNGAYVHKDAWYAEEIGKYWRDTITRGNGRYENCNSKKERYRYLGIGMVDHFDIEKRANLKRAVSYLCKTEQLIERESGSKIKAMRRGVVPTKASKAGRPRQLKPAQLAWDGQLW